MSVDLNIKINLSLKKGLIAGLVIPYTDQIRLLNVIRNHTEDMKYLVIDDIEINLFERGN